MGTYKNDYKKEEDACLWEIHEIRHKIHKKYKNNNEKINTEGKKLYLELMKKSDPSKIS